MAILDLIEFLDPTGEVLIAREPQDSSGALRYGSQLVVQDCLHRPRWMLHFKAARCCYIRMTMKSQEFVSMNSPPNKSI